MRHTITRQVIQYIGYIWMPNTMCAQVQTLDGYAMSNIGDPRNREDVERWLLRHSGDFQSIMDFRADFHVDDEYIVHEWINEDSEIIYNDCMYGSED